MAGIGLFRIFDPKVRRHLISDEGEVVIDEVRKHWAATVGAMLELLAGVIVLLLSLFVPPAAWCHARISPGTSSAGGVSPKIAASTSTSAISEEN